MHGRQHVRQLVKGRQVVEGRRAAHILEVAKIGRAGHRDENRLPSAKGDGLFGVAGVKRDLGRDRLDQGFDQPAVQMHPFAAHIGAGLAPVLERDVVTEDNADLFQNVERGRVDALYLFLIHRFGQRQLSGQCRQHRMVRPGAQITAFAPSATSLCVWCDCLVHNLASFSGSCH